MLTMETVDVGEDDRTARARIRDAAVAAFAERGVAATSVKAIAESADVSPALVFHHFGSKAGLRVACDSHVLGIVEQGKRQAMSAGPQLDVFAALHEQGAQPPVLGYLARMLTDGSPEAVTLVDGLVDVSVRALDDGVRSGLLRPVADPRDLSAVLVLWSLGLLVLHEHAERLLGIDIAGPPERRDRYVRAAMGALGGLFTDEARQLALRGLAGNDEEASDG
jgi:TetR/AcrR family transcriptional regulator, regulator of cefoperazone and chloramphenicol sensitivity